MANNTDPPSVTSRIEEDVPFYDVSNHEGVKEPYDKWGDVLIQLTEHKKAEGEGNRWASAKSLWFAVSPGIDPTSASASIVGQNRDTVLFSIDIAPSSMTATGLKEASRVILGGECEARNKALDSAILTHQHNAPRAGKSMPTTTLVYQSTTPCSILEEAPFLKLSLTLSHCEDVSVFQSVAA